jgi:hypothetical protein
MDEIVLVLILALPISEMLECCIKMHGSLSQEQWAWQIQLNWSGKCCRGKISGKTRQSGENI